MFFKTVYKKVDGLVEKDSNIYKEKIEVRITNDDIGCTLSLKALGLQISIPVEVLSPYIKKDCKTNRERNGFRGV